MITIYKNLKINYLKFSTLGTGVIIISVTNAKKKTLIR